MWFTEFSVGAFVDCDVNFNWSSLQTKAVRLIQPAHRAAIFNPEPLNTLSPIWASGVVLNWLNRAGAQYQIDCQYIDTKVDRHGY